MTDPKPAFVWRSLRIRYNPVTAPVAGTVHEDDDTTLFGMLTLRGFSPENAGIDAGIEGCWFELDESLPVGTLLIEPAKPERIHDAGEQLL